MPTPFPRASQDLQMVTPAPLQTLSNALVASSAALPQFFAMKLWTSLAPLLHTVLRADGSDCVLCASSASCPAFFSGVLFKCLRT